MKKTEELVSSNIALQGEFDPKEILITLKEESEKIITKF